MLLILGNTDLYPSFLLYLVHYQRNFAAYVFKIYSLEAFSRRFFEKLILNFMQNPDLDPSY